MRNWNGTSCAGLTHILLVLLLELCWLSGSTVHTLKYSNHLSVSSGTPSHEALLIVPFKKNDPAIGENQGLAFECCMQTRFEHYYGPLVILERPQQWTWATNQFYVGLNMAWVKQQNEMELQWMHRGIFSSVTYGSGIQATVTQHPGNRMQSLMTSQCSICSQCREAGHPHFHKVAHKGNTATYLQRRNIVLKGGFKATQEEVSCMGISPSQQCNSTLFLKAKWVKLQIQSTPWKSRSKNRENIPIVTAAAA